jgi:hypothetical protein
MLRKPKVRYRVHNSPPLFTDPEAVNTVHALPFYFDMIPSDIVPSTSLSLQDGSFPSDFPTKTLTISQTRQAIYYKRNTEERSRNYCCHRQEITTTYSELSYPAWKRMRRIILSSVACLVLPYFPTLSLTRHDFRDKVIKHNILVLIFSKTLSKEFLILTRIQRDIIINIICVCLQYSLFLSDLNETWTLVTDCRQIPKYQISWKSVQWQSRCSMQTDWHDETNGRYSQFYERA